MILCGRKRLATWPPYQRDDAYCKQPHKSDHCQGLLLVQSERFFKKGRRYLVSLYALCIVGVAKYHGANKGDTVVPIRQMDPKDRSLLLRDPEKST